MVTFAKTFFATKNTVKEQVFCRIHEIPSFVESAAAASDTTAAAAVAVAAAAA